MSEWLASDRDAGDGQPASVSSIEKCSRPKMVLLVPAKYCKAQRLTAVRGQTLAACMTTPEYKRHVMSLMLILMTCQVRFYFLSHSQTAFDILWYPLICDFVIFHDISLSLSLSFFSLTAILCCSPVGSTAFRSAVREEAFPGSSSASEVNTALKYRKKPQVHKDLQYVQYVGSKQRTKELLPSHKGHALLWHATLHDSMLIYEWSMYV